MYTNCEQDVEDFCSSPNTDICKNHIIYSYESSPETNAESDGIIDSYLPEIKADYGDTNLNVKEEYDEDEDDEPWPMIDQVHPSSSQSNCCTCHHRRYFHHLRNRRRYHHKIQPRVNDHDSSVIRQVSLSIRVRIGPKSSNK